MTASNSLVAKYDLELLGLLPLPVLGLQTRVTTPSTGSSSDEPKALCMHSWETLCQLSYTVATKKLLKNIFIKVL